MSCISINLKKEETLVKIEDNATEEEIIGELKIKLAELTKLYASLKSGKFWSKLVSLMHLFILIGSSPLIKDDASINVNESFR